MAPAPPMELFAALQAGLGATLQQNPPLAVATMFGAGC
jgi:hypothetical protein